MTEQEVRRKLWIAGSRYKVRTSLKFLERIKELKIGPDMTKDDVEFFLNECGALAKKAGNALKFSNLHDQLELGFPIIYLSGCLPALGFPSPIDGVIFTEPGVENTTEYLQVECWPVEIDCREFPQWKTSSYGIRHDLRKILEGANLPFVTPNAISNHTPEEVWWKNLDLQGKTTIHVLRLKMPPGENP